MNDNSLNFLMELSKDNLEDNSDKLLDSIPKDKQQNLYKFEDVEDLNDLNKNKDKNDNVDKNINKENQENNLNIQQSNSATTEYKKDNINNEQEKDNKNSKNLNDYFPRPSAQYFPQSNELFSLNPKAPKQVDYFYNVDDLLKDNNDINNKQKESKDLNKEKEKSNHNNENFDDLLENDFIEDYRNQKEQKFKENEKSTNKEIISKEKNNKEYKISFNQTTSQKEKDNKKYKNNNNIKTVSNIEQAEQMFQKLKVEINEILSDPETNNVQILTMQNGKMLGIFSSLNDVITLVSNNNQTQKNQTNKPQTKPLTKNDSNEEDDNEKLLEKYQKEYDFFKRIIDNYNNGEYIDKIHKELSKLKEEIEFYTANNTKLNNDKLYSEAKNNQQKPSKSQVILKRTEKDYENTKELFESIQVEIEKNKKKITKNEAKITELRELQKKLQQNAKDMNITEFDNINAVKKKENKNEMEFHNLKRILGIINGARGLNKKNYEKMILKKRKDIMDKKQIKLALQKRLKDQTIRVEQLNQKYQEMYALLFNKTPVEPKEEIEKKEEEIIIPKEKKIKENSKVEIKPKEETKKDKPKENNEIKKEPLVLPIVHNNNSNNKYILPPIKKRKFNINIKLNDIVQNNENDPLKGENDKQQKSNQGDYKEKEEKYEEPYKEDLLGESENHSMNRDIEQNDEEREENYNLIQNNEHDKNLDNDNNHNQDLETKEQKESEDADNYIFKDSSHKELDEQKIVSNDFNNLDEFAL